MSAAIVSAVLVSAVLASAVIVPALFWADHTSNVFAQDKSHTYRQGCGKCLL